MSSLRGRLVLVVTGLALLQADAAAQGNASDWITRHQDALWGGAFVDQPLTAKWSGWFDGSWRRMDFGQEPQQLLLRPGVQYTVAPGLKLGGGYGYIATSMYGNLPAANPTREHRTWQQVSVSHKNGRVAFSHRYRLEQRWIAPMLLQADGEREAGDPLYQNRARYMGRAQMDLPGVKVGGRPVIAFVWDELLMPFGGKTALLSVGQNRATAGIGIPLSPRMRAEVGYMNLLNEYAPRRANEINHTLWLSWHWTGTKALLK